ncbi:hypothetical protein JXL21_04130 [Candidatus Bathyarchaeota archaeon]|nr:hypothetical protein [Candidatus Bathyarchaeota archaeon]
MINRYNTEAQMIIADIPVKLDIEAVLRSLKISRDTPYATKKIRELIETITPIMRPKAVYKRCNVEATTSQTVSIDGRTFNSRVLAKNLADQKQCYPYIVTAGEELEQISIPNAYSLMLLDLVKNVVVEQAYQYTKQRIVEKHGVEHITRMSPGHLDDWQLDQQRPLFDLIGSEIEKIGVSLTDSYLMLPPKTISGIFFTSETGFQSCQICTQARCMGRRAPYDPEIAKQYGL